MAFIPRTFEEIRDDMIDFVRLQTDLTDFEVGSVIRTIIESAALEDDEQYFQMVQLLDAFRLSTATGDDLDDRVAEYGIIRLQPASSAGEIVIRDETLVTSLVAFTIAVGAITVQLEDTSDFPTSSFPFTLRLGEGTVDVEDVSVTANNTATNTLTISATTNAHDAGERGSVVSGAADQTLNTGIKVQVPATSTVAATTFVTTESGTLVNGNYESTPISIRAEVPGSGGNVGANKIVEFLTNPPFDGASVTNLSNTSGGRNLETDAQLRDRARSAIQALSKGTVLALLEGVLGVADPVTGQRVTTANILESFVNDEVVVYVDDGTGFNPDTVVLPSVALNTGGPDLPIGSSTMIVTDSSDLPEEGFVIVSPENPAQIELVEYSAVDYGTHTLTLVGVTANLHNDADEVVLVDVLTEAAESGQNFFQTSNYPIVRNSQRIWLNNPAGTGIFTLQSEGTSYFLSKGTGQVEFIGAGVAVNSIIVAEYSYYTGLIAQVQLVIDGDPDDAVNYPGIRAAGINVVAETPTIRRITVRVSITAANGVQEQDLIPQVQETIESYINGLGIGEDVIIAEIIERAMAVPGMFDIVVELPTSNTVVLETELPVPYDANGNSLVTVV